MRSGPLIGIRVIEFASIGPGPFCGMLLSDLGADVVRVERPDARNSARDFTLRGRRSVIADLKSPTDIERCLALVERADVLIEGLRPGVMERLGLGPDVIRQRNPRLIYGRMTGWGQQGPLASAAGHDLNYIALSGALHAMGERDGVPMPPLNLIGDFGGGSLYLAFGICAALLERQRSGQGQVIDCAITDGTASLMTLMFGLQSMGRWTNERESNLLDGGLPSYRCYRCKDDKFISIAALEPQFYRELLQRLQLQDDPEMRDPYDRTRWATQRERFAQLFSTRTRDDWASLLEGTDACVAGVYTMDEAPTHPHNIARQTFVDVEGLQQPAPAPRFSRTPGAIQHAAIQAVSFESLLSEWT